MNGGAVSLYHLSGRRTTPSSSLSSLLSPSSSQSSRSLPSISPPLLSSFVLSLDMARRKGAKGKPSKIKAPDVSAPKKCACEGCANTRVNTFCRQCMCKKHCLEHGGCTLHKLNDDETSGRARKRTRTSDGSAELEQAARATRAQSRSRRPDGRSGVGTFATSASGSGPPPLLLSSNLHSLPLAQSPRRAASVSVTPQRPQLPAVAANRGVSTPPIPLVSHSAARPSASSQAGTLGSGNPRPTPVPAPAPLPSRDPPRHASQTKDVFGEVFEAQLGRLKDQEERDRLAKDKERRSVRQITLLVFNQVRHFSINYLATPLICTLTSYRIMLVRKMSPCKTSPSLRLGPRLSSLRRSSNSLA